MPQLAKFEQPPTLPELEVNSTADSESFKDLIREIGLKLEPAQGPVETFIIDHAEKPSPN